MIENMRVSNETHKNINVNTFLLHFNTAFILTVIFN